MALGKLLVVPALVLLALIAVVNMDRFLSSEQKASADRGIRSRSLRETATAQKLDNELAVLEKFGEDRRIKTLNDELGESTCMGTPNRTVIRKEDLELSCAEFHRTRPSIAQAFGYLGEEAVKSAKVLRDRIQKQEMHGGRVRLAIGPGPSPPRKGGFLPSDYPIVDITNATRLAALFEEASVEALIASHVWEHFTYPQTVQALQNVRCLMTDNAIARFGVPDAQHPDQMYHANKAREGFPNKEFRASYRNSVSPGHRALWTEDKFAVAASLAGLNARPLEWWSSGSIDERKFCNVEYNEEENGRITRSLRRDSRNTKENPYAYTSLIVDLSPQVLH